MNPGLIALVLAGTSTSATSAAEPEASRPEVPSSAPLAGTSTSPAGRVRVQVDAPKLPGCLSADQLRASLADAEGRGVVARMRIRPSEPGRRMRVDVELRASERRLQRGFLLRRRDCPLLPELIARIWRRFRDELPRPGPPPVRTARLPPPRWPGRRRLWVGLSGAPGLEGAERIGAHAGFAAGRSGGLMGVLGLGYDVVPRIALGAGSAQLHAGWLGGGVGYEAAAGPLQGWGTAALVAGAAVAQGRDFEQSETQVLPVARLRLAARATLASWRDGWSPHVGAVLEASPFDVRLSAEEAAIYREPPLRIELCLGLSWVGTRW